MRVKQVELSRLSTERAKLATLHPIISRLDAGEMAVGVFDARCVASFRPDQAQTIPNATDKDAQKTKQIGAERAGSAAGGGGGGHSSRVGGGPARFLPPQLGNVAQRTSGLLGIAVETERRPRV